MKTWLTDLEVGPSKGNMQLPLKELRHRQVQEAVEQLVRRNESSTENVSLRRGKIDFVEAYWIR